MGKGGSPFCRYIDYTCYIFLDSEEREECNATKIIIIYSTKYAEVTNAKCVANST